MPDAAAPVYLYGVIRDRDARDLDVPPINGESPVYTIAHCALAAVVSDEPLPHYELTRKNIRGHEAVVEHVMRTGDILPTRLGTVLPSARAIVDDLLEKRRSELLHLLQYVTGRVELGLKASWTDLHRVFQEIVAGDRGLRALRDHMTKHRTAATYEARLDLGTRAEQLLLAKREQEADRLVAAIEPQAVSVCRNDPISELMVLNAAFLVERRELEAFEAVVRDVDRANDGRLRFLLAGPLPPYNFVAFNEP